MKLVVAVDPEWGIGNKGDLLARVRADLRYFQSLTKNHVVVLGSNTLATFPHGRVLKDRVTIVLNPSPDYAPEGAVVAHSISELFALLADYDTNDVFVIGGASVYRQLLPYCDTAYVTRFGKVFEKDVYFENLDASPEWRLASEGEVMISDPETDTVGGMPFRFCRYERTCK